MNDLQKVQVLGGALLVVLGFVLCSMIFRSVGTPCETSGWQDFILLASACCVWSKAGGYIAGGLGLRRDSS